MNKFYFKRRTGNAALYITVSVYPNPTTQEVCVLIDRI